MAIKALFLLLLMTNLVPSYSNAAKISDDSSEITCSICIEEVDSNDNITLSCSHSFCKQCITGWAHTQSVSQYRQTEKTCPNCRTPFTPTDKVKLNLSLTWRERLKLKLLKAKKLASRVKTYVKRNPITVVTSFLLTGVLAICSYLNISRAKKAQAAQNS